MKNIFIGLLLCALSSTAQVSFEKKEDKVVVKINKKVFTNYYFPSADKLKKAVLYPVFSPKGDMITRGWPLDPKPGERVDHPHHVGVWLNYEDANGHDFWNNSNDIDPAKRKYGTILHQSIHKIKGGMVGELAVKAMWVDEKSKDMLSEETSYFFGGDKDKYYVDRVTTLTAVIDTVHFKDVKDGFFAIRVNRNLEHPSTAPEIFTDASGIATKVPKLDNTGVTGKYKNAEGIEGEKTWGLRSAWVSLEGNMDSGDKSVSIIDHPKNINFPSYWHTRGYGLFSVNPLGEAVLQTIKKG